jgi:hypothetical protein
MYAVSELTSGGSDMVIRYFSVGGSNAGQLVAISTDHLLWVSHGVDLGYFVGLHVNNSEPEPVECAQDDSVAAVLQWGDRYTPAERVLILGPPDVDYYLRDFDLIVDGEVHTENYLGKEEKMLNLRHLAEERGVDLSSTRTVAVTGFSIRARLCPAHDFQEPDLVVEIPVVDGTLGLSDALLTGPVTLRRGEHRN